MLDLTITVFFQFSWTALARLFGRVKIVCVPRCHRLTFNISSCDVAQQNEVQNPAHCSSHFGPCRLKLESEIRMPSSRGKVNHAELAPTSQELGGVALHSGWRIADTSACQDGVDGVAAEESPRRLCIEFTQRATPEVFGGIFGPPNAREDIGQAHRKRKGEEEHFFTYERLPLVLPREDGHRARSQQGWQLEEFRASSTTALPIDRFRDAVEADNELINDTTNSVDPDSRAESVANLQKEDEAEKQLEQEAKDLEACKSSVRSWVRQFQVFQIEH